jgi:uncharacterized protein YyaL (SSP411 family)
MQKTNCTDNLLGHYLMAFVAIGTLVAWGQGPDAQLTSSTQPGIVWREWSPNVFAEAKKENKFVLLDLHAFWCHWCHVMDETTYADPKVIALVGSKYIAVGVDADARPDLAQRYENYGWPATVVYDADQKEIVKRQGYLSPAMMASMLQAIIDDPTPGPSVSPEKKIDSTSATFLTPDIRTLLLGRLNDNYDSTLGGWGTIHKYFDWDNLEWCLRESARGNKADEAMARQTLLSATKLIDPVWGGADQYSVNGDWDHPHYEKIMQFQAEEMRIYSMAYLQFKDPADLDTAENIHRFLTNFLLSPEGAFYVSQDADLVPGVQSDEYYKLSDAQRRQRGVPRVDKHEYARENGWAIRGLVALYGATGNRTILAQAERAAKWVIENRSDEKGFFHGQYDSAGPYLGDSLAMGQAFLSLYRATGDAQWLKRSEGAAEFVRAHFISNALSGVMTSAYIKDTKFSPYFELDENVGVARWANDLNHETKNQADRELADRAMRYLAAPEIAKARQMSVGGILLASEECSRATAR